MNKYINNNLVSPFSVVCMCMYVFRVTTQYWKTNWEKLILLFSVVINCLWLFIQWQVLVKFPPST